VVRQRSQCVVHDTPHTLPFVRASMVSTELYCTPPVAFAFVEQAKVDAILPCIPGVAGGQVQCFYCS
jgi:hypothetical protein